MIGAGLFDDAGRAARNGDLVLEAAVLDNQRTGPVREQSLAHKVVEVSRLVIAHAAGGKGINGGDELTLEVLGVGVD